MALVTAAAETLEPVSWLTISPATSPAILRTSFRAAALVAAIDFLCCCDLLGNLGIDLGPLGINFGIELITGFLGDAVSLGAGLGQCLLVGSDSLVGLVLEALRGIQVISNLGLTLLDNTTDPGQRDTRHQQIKTDEGDRQPDQLR